MDDERKQREGIIVHVANFYLNITGLLNFE